MKNLVSIVIPVYNEEQYIAQTISRVVNANLSGYHREIIIINDGSLDNSAKIILSTIKKIHPSSSKTSFKYISTLHNHGKGAALKKGLIKSKGNIVIIQDADLEYNPDDFPLLIEPFIKNQADVVYGSRFISNRPHRVIYYWHFQINKFLTFLSNILTNLNFTDIETGYKVFRGDLIRQIAQDLISQRFGFEPEVTAKIAKLNKSNKLKIYEVGISYSGRTYQEGKKITWLDGLKALWEILRFNLLT